MTRQTTSNHRPQARRQPRQQRALQTRQLIFEAATQLLEAEGLAAFTTNRLAAVSGFSVGTIYQYFSDKHDLLAALARHEVERALASARRRTAAHTTASTAMRSDDPQARARAAVRGLLGLFGGRTKARRELLAAALLRGDTDALERPVQALAALLEERRDARGLRHLDPQEAYVLAHAVLGPVRAALLHDPRRLRQAAFENALVRLVVGFLAATPAPVAVTVHRSGG